MDDPLFDLSFHVPIIPTGLARPRVTLRGTYTPKKSRKAKADIDIYARIAMKKAGLLKTKAPVAVLVGAHFPIPESFPAAAKKTARAGALWKISIPDVDNVLKLALDAITGPIIWNDAQVVLCVAAKMVGPEPGIFITVREIRQGTSITDAFSTILAR